MDGEIHDAAETGATGPEEELRPIIVGIGASAGGLEALTQLVANLPRQREMSYVVAQHMSPQHKSMMVDLLARATSLPVVEATEGQKLQSNTIYITPPNRNIEIRDHAVVLTGPYAEGPKPSVDLLFMSLAEDVGERVVGVILSGTGSDGARGVQAIKNVGGITIAQSPETAKYNGMPEAALRTGKIDKVLAPDQIGNELASLTIPSAAAREAEAGERDSDGGRDPDGLSGSYHSVIGLIRHRMNIDFQQYKPGTIHRRIQRRMAANRLAVLEDYVEYLTNHPDEVEKLCADILISVTSFFRDRPAWEALGAAIGRLLERKPAREPVRIQGTFAAAAALNPDAVTIPSGTPVPTRTPNDGLSSMLGLPPGVNDLQKLVPVTISKPASSSSMRNLVSASPSPLLPNSPGYSYDSYFATPGNGNTELTVVIRLVLGVSKL